MRIDHQEFARNVTVLLLNVFSCKSTRMFGMKIVWFVVYVILIYKMSVSTRVEELSAGPITQGKRYYLIYAFNPCQILTMLFIARMDFY